MPGVLLKGDSPCLDALARKEKAPHAISGRVEMRLRKSEASFCPFSHFSAGTILLSKDAIFLRATISPRFCSPGQSHEVLDARVVG